MAFSDSGRSIQSTRYSDRATLYLATLNALYRLSQHAHLVFRHPIPLAEAWLFAYENIQSTQISVPDECTREPASPSCQIGQQGPKREALSDMGARCLRVYTLTGQRFPQSPHRPLILRLGHRERARSMLL